MFRVRVLGGLTVETADGISEPPANRKTLALLGWLGMLPRASVAAALWPDVLDASAQRSLRTALWSLRTALGTAADVLLTTRDRVGLDPERVSIDVQEFDALVAVGRLDEAVGISAGELLPGFEDEWAIRARDAHRERLAEVLDALAERVAAGGDPAEAVRWARRRSALDSFSEEGARALMTRLADAGDRAAALGVYDRLVERLRDQLSIAVSTQTRRLASDLRAATAPAPRSVYGRVPLVGRRNELAALREAWELARSGTGGAVLLRGPAGIGKSRLVGELCVETARTGGVVAIGGDEPGAVPPPRGGGDRARAARARCDRGRPRPRAARRGRHADASHQRGAAVHRAAHDDRRRCAGQPPCSPSRRGARSPAARPRRRAGCAVPSAPHSSVSRRPPGSWSRQPRSRDAS